MFHVLILGKIIGSFPTRVTRFQDSAISYFVSSTWIPLGTSTCHLLKDVEITCMASLMVPLRNDEIFGAIVIQYFLTISPFICGVHAVGLTNKRSDCQETAYIILFRSKCLSYPGLTDIRIQSGHKSEQFTVRSFHIIQKS